MDRIVEPKVEERPNFTLKQRAILFVLRWVIPMILVGFGLALIKTQHTSAIMDVACNFCGIMLLYASFGMQELYQNTKKALTLGLSEWISFQKRSTFLKAE